MQGHVHTLFLHFGLDRKLNEVFYISKNKPDLKQTVNHFNTFLTL